MDIHAGLDIVGLGLLAQNVDAGAVSQIVAGRDIKYPIQRDPVTGDVLGASQSIRLAGPGQLRMLAGRNIDLGSADGIRSVGNLLNPGLAGQGADLLIFAGLGSLSESEVFTKNQADDLFKALRLSATSAAATDDAAAKSAAYQTGYDAIAALFPKKGYQGDIKLFFSAIQTLDGGDIQLLAPGGLVNVGLPTAFSGNKTAGELGIVAQREGNIDILVRDDLLVNRSRVFTLDGGDITVWSSEGNIDAGRGAKSALSAPLPVTGFDSQGNLVVIFPPTVSGSGIHAQSGTGKGKAGDPVLAAPKGIVDAGEAGIGGNNIVIAAKAVIGADNIQALGATTGVPQVQAIAVPSASAGNSLAAVSNAAESMIQDQAPSKQEAVREIKPVPQSSTLTAQVLGFGDCSVSDVKSGKPGCGN